MAKRVVITRDLMDSSKFRAAAPDMAVARDADSDLLAGAELVILDLSSGVSPSDVVAPGRKVIAYGSHVDTDALDDARQAGCDEVMPRSRMFRDLARWVTQ